MTIGDVFSVVASIFGIFLTAWATIVGAALLMPVAADRARRAIAQPKASLGRGALITIPLTVFGIVLIQFPAPLIKLIGWMLMLFWMSLAAVGATGLAMVAGRRIQDMDGAVGAYGSLCRGAAFIVGAGILPILGWFAFGPLLIVASTGAGWSAMFSARSESVSEVA